MADVKKYVAWKNGLELGLREGFVLPDSDDLISIFEQVEKLAAVESVLLDEEPDPAADISVIRGIVFAGEEGMTWR